MTANFPLESKFEWAFFKAGMECPKMDIPSRSACDVMSQNGHSIPALKKKVIQILNFTIFFVKYVTNNRFKFFFT